MTKLEEATKALARKLGEFERDAAVSELTAEEHRALVVAVVEALRTPSEEMIEVGNTWTGWHGPDSADIWESMIDAALTEERAGE